MFQQTRQLQLNESLAMCLENRVKGTKGFKLLMRKRFTLRFLYTQISILILIKIIEQHQRKIKFNSKKFSFVLHTIQVFNPRIVFIQIYFQFNFVNLLFRFNL